MGLIGEVAGQNEARMREAAALQHVDTYASITATLDQLSDVLTADQFSGDVDTAFVHHFGREAFGEQWTVGVVQRLIDRIDAEDMDEVPVVMTHKQDHMLTTYILFADSNATAIRSSREIEKDVPMHVYDSEKADVTKRTLGIEGMTVELNGALELADPGSIRPESSDQFLMSYSEGVGSRDISLPGGYPFGNDAWERFSCLDSAIVGWEALEDKILKRITPERAQVELRRYKELLPKLSIWSSVTRERMPRLGEAMEALESFDRAIGNIALGRKPRQSGISL